MNHAVRKSEHILAVSNFTAGDIQKTYGEHLAGKITVTHEGVSDNFFPASIEEKNRIRKEFDLPDSFILYAGACKEHKNVQTLIDAMPMNETLVLVTRGKEVARLRLTANIRVLNDVPEHDLPLLMSAASVYVQPSLYEGFGLPVLEAMACGTPVVATRRTSIPEIAGEYALLVEPTVGGIRNGIETVRKYPVDTNAAERHARSFSWKRMAEKTTAIYASLLLQ